MIGLMWTHNHLTQYCFNFQSPLFYQKYSPKIAIKIGNFKLKPQQ